MCDWELLGEPADLVVLSPCSAGLQQLLAICSVYGLENDILNNNNNSTSVVVICRKKEDKSLNFPVFRLPEKDLAVCAKVKYLGHLSI